MAYIRQYTQGVGWENEPSTNTPISAENLNQMDNAILNIDAAVAAAFADVSGGRIFSDYVKSVRSYNELVTSTNIYSGDTQKAGDVVILYMDVNATYDSSLSTDTWGIVYGSLSFGLIADYRDASHAGQTFTEYIAKGSTLIIVCNRNTRLWELRAIIPAGGGGGRVLSDHVTSVADGTRLITSANIFSSQNPQDGDMLFIYVDVDATLSLSMAVTWSIAFGSSGTLSGSINDFRTGNTTDVWQDDISAGSLLILTKIPLSESERAWALRAVIPAAGAGGGCGYDAAVIGDDATPTSVYSSGSMPIALTIDGFTLTPNATAMVRMGKLTTIDYSAPGTEGLYFNINSTGAIPVYYNNTKVTGDSVFTFDKNALYILLLRAIASQQEPWRFDIVGISNSSGGASTLAALTDTNISTPSDGQFLKYDATSAKWINASGGGGGASSLADLTDTTITSPSAAQPLTYNATTSKWINGGVIPIENGGTGNADGYIQTGRKANTTIGNWATAEGYNTTASGSQSHAEGYNTQATDTNSHAEGDGTNATEYCAHAEGTGSTASGEVSHAEGGATTASGGMSHAEGGLTTASGDYSHTEGYNTTASGDYSHAQGLDTIASANYSSAAGRATTAGYENQFVIGKFNDNKSTSIFEVGIGTANNARTNGMELDTSGNLKTAGTVTDSSGAPLAPSSALAPVENGATASQAYASGEHFMRNGKFCTATTAIASGDTLIAETNYSEGNVAGSLGGGGGSSTLSGLTDTTISSPTAAQPLTYDATNSKWINGGVIPIANGGTGNNSGYVRTGRKANTNIGTNATAEGLSTTASGNYSHAEGSSTTASGQGAHAEGTSTYATQNSAHAEGMGTTASGQGAHAEGQSNTASGLASHVEGMSNTASARSSHAQGEGCKANAQYASAAGNHTTAGYENQFIVGKYNDNKSTNIFEVGIGTGNLAKANGLELDTSGNLKTAGTITDGQGHVLGQPVVADGVWVISGETATLTVTTP